MVYSGATSLIDEIFEVLKKHGATCEYELDHGQRADWKLTIRGKLPEGPLA